MSLENELVTCPDLYSTLAESRMPFTLNFETYEGRRDTWIIQTLRVEILYLTNFPVSYFGVFVGVRPQINVVPFATEHGANELVSFGSNRDSLCPGMC